MKKEVKIIKGNSMRLDDFADVFNREVKDDNKWEQFKKFCKVFGFDENEEVTDFIEKEEIEIVKEQLKDLKK